MRIKKHFKGIKGYFKPIWAGRRFHWWKNGERLIQGIRRAPTDNEIAYQDQLVEAFLDRQDMHYKLAEADSNYGYEE